LARLGAGYNQGMHRFDEHCHRVMSELVEAGRVLDEYRPDLGAQLRAETARFADLLRELRDEVGSDEPPGIGRQRWSA
jgi:hypothetical protein